MRSLAFMLLLLGCLCVRHEARQRERRLHRAYHEVALGASSDLRIIACDPEEARMADEFDYVMVGGGSAGAVVAARL